MRLHERILYHQVHPLKLAVDWLTAACATWLFWNHLVWTALAVGLVPPAIISWYLIQQGDFAGTAQSTLGSYVRQHMTPAMQAVRLLGVAIAWIAALLQVPALIGLGVLVIVLGWSRGAWAR